MRAMKDATLPPCVVSCAVYNRQGQRRDISLDQISDVLAVDDGSFVWVGLYEPDDGILEKLQEEFCLHDLAIEDAQNAHQRPKIESYGNSLFIVVHTAQGVDSHIRFGESHFFVGPRYLTYVAALEMHPLDTEDRTEELKTADGIGLCNITKCCTTVCPEGIHITDNAIIPLKERVADRYYDPLKALVRLVRGKSAEAK